MKTNRVMHAATNLLLRSMPLMAGPELLELIRVFTNSRKELDKQVEEAAEALKNTARLVSKLEQDLHQRTEKVKELKAQIDYFSELSEIEENKAKVLIKQIESTFGTQTKKQLLGSFIISGGFGLLFFILGALFSDSLSKGFAFLIDYF